MIKSLATGFGRGSRSSTAAVLLGTTALAASLAVSSPAKADDVSDLKAENQALRSEVDNLAQEIGILKNMVVENHNTAQAAVKAAENSVPQKVVTSGKEKVSLSISGQVNRMMLFGDDGNQARWFNADNDRSSTRVRFKGKAKMDEEWSAGTNIEVQFESNSTADVTIDQENAALDNNSFTERKLELYFESEQFGKLSIGQGDTASNGTAETDLSGTGVISGADYHVLAKEMDFVLSGTNGTSTGDDPGDLFDNFDGLSRDDRLRYDTPSFGGVKLSASWADGDKRDVAVRFGRKYEGMEVAAAASYWDKEPSNQEDGYSLSGSIKADMGVSLSAAYSEKDFKAENRNSAEFWWAKVGHQWKVLEAGKSAVSFAYSETEEQDANNSSGAYWELAGVQKIDGLGAEIYAVYSQFDADIPNEPSDEITVGGIGARIKF